MEQEAADQLDGPVHEVCLPGSASEQSAKSEEIFPTNTGRGGNPIITEAHVDQTPMQQSEPGEETQQETVTH